MTIKEQKIIASTIRERLTQIPDTEKSESRAELAALTRNLASSLFTTYPTQSKLAKGSSSGVEWTKTA